MKLIEFILRLLGRRKISLADYPRPGVDYGLLNATQRSAMDSILMACKLGGAGAEIPVITQEDFDRVIVQIGMHFGNDDLCRNIALKRGNSAAVNLSIYEQAKTHKAKLDKWVEEALSKLNEGTNEEKLKQIAKCIADHAKYGNGTNNPLSLLEDGAMCGAYSMLFYKMARRIGVEAYICYGTASNGIYTGAHAWNKVQLPDGAAFYDITFYDSGLRSGKWLGSRDGWGREYGLNNKSALQKRG